jgi:hypothetical protein
MATEFKANGIRAAAIWGEDIDRAKKLDQLRNGDIEVLCNCAVLIEGYDDWHIAAIVMARPTKSQLLFVQCIGRGTRIPEGIDNLLDAQKAGWAIPKTDCVVLDVVDATTKHNIVTIPQLFGMARHMDMKGRTITSALNHFNSVQQQHPNADLTNAPDLTHLNSFAVSVDLFSMKWASEVLEGSNFQWHRNADGHYTLYLRKGRVDINEDILGKWHVIGNADRVEESISGLLVEDTATHFEIAEHDLPNLPAAFDIAERFVNRSVPKECTLLRREAPWHKEKASEAQIKLLHRLHIMPKPNMTKGEAQLAISRVLKKK